MHVQVHMCAHPHDTHTLYFNLYRLPVMESETMNLRIKMVLRITVSHLPLTTDISSPALLTGSHLVSV